MSPTDKIAVEMERQQWVSVCNLLAEHPFKLSAPAINAISAALAVKGNGKDAPEARRGRSEPRAESAPG
jgi:hypothetical protein